jgi:photosystem II stability/assembly factor-like uncharacterized protein
MKKLLIIFAILFFTQFAYSQWVSDGIGEGTPLDDDIMLAVSHIQFINQNIGWVSSPGLRDTVFKTTNSGLNWTGYTTADTNKLSSVFFIDQNTGWAVGKRGKIVKTTTGGISWILQSSGVQSWLNDVYFSDALTGFIVGSYDSSRVILKTTNGGSNWQKILTNGTGKLFAIKMLNSTTAFAVGDSGTILLTSNGGINWVNQFSNVNSTIRDIVMKSSSRGCAVGLNGAILTTTNGGTNWINRSFNTVNFFGIDLASQDSGYVCGRGRIYKTVNGGVNWTQQTTPVLDTINIKDIFCITSNNVWAVPDRGILIFTTNGGTSGINQIISETPTGYSLSQNYPNPFNPSTKIQFAIPKNGFIKLSVFDITGKTMAVLANETMKTGTYEVEWDASHRASGVYFYKLETENYSVTKRMVLIK